MTWEVPEGLRAAQIADACDALGVAFGAGAGAFRWTGAGRGAAIGPAYTIQQRALHPGEMPSPPGNPTHRDAAARLAPPGSLIVVAVAGETTGATWGEAHAMRAVGRGVAGMLVDGLLRDAGSLRAQSLPVLFRGTSPLKSTGRLRTQALEAEVVVSGVPIRPGDLVAIDEDGFVCVPLEAVEAVLAAAAEILRKEQDRDRTGSG